MPGTTPIPKTSNPALRAFTAAGITTLEDFANWSRTDLLALHGVGPKAIRILEPELALIGIDFAPEGAQSSGGG